ncbi:MAG: translocation/assembly module TamB domain-containing protein [Bacteroidota bacterium]
MQPTRTKNIIRKIFKIFAWILLSIICLFLLVLILIQLPSVQNFGRKKIVSFLEKKIGTPVQITRLDIDFPKIIVLEGVYFEDQAKDTLLAGKKLKVDISLFKLLKNKVEINEISLSGITGNIKRNADGVFNFDYIINAFATEPKTDQTDTTSMQIALDEINLDKIKLKYHDDFMGYDMAFSLNHFDTDIKTFDLENSKYETDDITLEGVTASLRQYKPLGEKIAQLDSSIKPDSAVYVKPLDLTFGEIDLTKIKIDYKNEIDSVFTNLQLGRLNVQPDKINVAGERIDLSSFLLQNTTANIYLGRKPAALKIAKDVSNAADTVGAIIQKQGWIVYVNKAIMKNNHFVYNDNNSAPISKGMDYSHLDISKLRLDANSLYYQADSISGEINDFGFTEKSGVNIVKFKTDFLYTATGASLSKLYLETPDTRLQRSLDIRYPSIQAVSKNIGLLVLDADLSGSEIGFKDILYFAPQLAAQPLFAKYPNGKLKTDIVLKGSLQNLLIQEFEISGLQNTHIKLSGRLAGMPDVNKIKADLNIADISSTDTDLIALLPKNSLPANIRIPQKIAMNGFVKGSMQQIQTNLNLRSSFGDAIVKATVSNPVDSIRAVYTAGITLSNFNAGRLLKQEEQVGFISMNANVNGRGYTPSRMSVAATGKVISAQLKNYTYRNLTFDGSGAQGLYELTADIDDPNIDLDVKASANLNGAKPAIRSTIMIDSLSMLPLHFGSKDIRLHSKISADIPNLDIDNLQGNIEITELLVNTGTQRFVSDTIVVNATRTDTGNTVTLTSPILTAGLNGKYTLSGLGAAVQRIINKYYNVGTPPPTDNIPYNVSFYARLFNSPFLRELMPQLSLTDSVLITGNMNSISNEIVVKGTIPALSYGTNKIQKADIAINTTDSAINYAININGISGTSFKIPLTSLNGQVVNNTIAYNLSVKDNDNKEKYLVAGKLVQQNGNYLVSLLPDGLKLDYDNWTVNPQNKIEFGSNGIRASAFEIGNTEQSLVVKSQTPNFNAPLSIQFSNFRIESLSKIAEQDSLYMGGIINGNALVSNLTATPVFDANITVSNFNYKKDTLGDIVIKANNKGGQSYNADIAITGNGNSLKANGDYYTAGEGRFDFDVNLEQLNLASIESFTAGNLKQMSGTMTGRMKITGNMTSPKVIGNLDFKQAAMNVAMLNSLFRINDERISFRDDGIHFDSFTIHDSSNNTAVLNGAIFTTDYKKYRFNLDLDANNFQTLSSTKRDNPMYYGNMFVDTKIRVRGDINKPEVNADLKVNDKTVVTIVLPQSDPQVAARDGIVTFFDQDHPQLDSMLLAQYDTLNHSSIKGLDVVANITIDKGAEFSMIIDEANGDFVRIKGEGNLSGGIDPSGKMSLTGTYEINEGGYEMSFNMLRRKFTIQEGSTLTWQGEPTAADVNVTAVYVANAPPIDLVDQQLTGVSETIRNTYKQKLPFNVLLTMKGELLKPVLSFDIILPDKNYTVSSDIVNASNTKLTQIRQDPGELNKQVFALLLLNRFVAEDPFSSGGDATSVSTMAKQSVSRLLSEQLNRLAGDLISGVDLNFGLETTEDYTTGRQQDRTDLNIGVSKKLMNDRLNVSVGSNFELEGPQQSNQRSNNIAGNIQVDYQLNKEGTLLLRGFRTDQYEVALQGQVVETGLTFILSVDYDKLREIIERRKEKKIIKEQVKEEKERLAPVNDSIPGNNRD